MGAAQAILQYRNGLKVLPWNSYTILMNIQMFNKKNSIHLSKLNPYDITAD